MEPEILHAHTEDKEVSRKSITVGSSSSSSSGQDEDGNSRTNNTNGLERPGTSGQGTAGGDHEEQSRIENSDDHIIIDVHDNNGGDFKDEKICRICHLSDEPSSSRTSGLMQLGCHCKAELGTCHPHCAETWFKHKGNSVCEICGVRAKNVKFVKNYNSSRMFIVDFEDIRPITRVAPYPSPEEGSRRCKQSCCNFLLACLVLGLVVPWFFRTHLF